jgi:hypothetical protein
VLRRIIAADLDTLAGLPPLAEEGSEEEHAEARRVRHRQRLAEPEPQPKRLSMREERTLLRALLDRPPSDRGGRGPAGAGSSLTFAARHPAAWSAPED